MTPSPIEGECPWRLITQWELDDFYRQVRTTIIELEEAYSNDRLAACLEERDLAARVGHHVVESYARLQRAPVPRLPHLRIGAVRSMLAMLREEIFEITDHAHARVDGTLAFDPVRCTAVQAPARPIVARIGDAPEESLRFDQLLAARFWGIGFVFEDVAVTTELAHQLAHASTDELAFGLRGVQRVLERFRSAEPNPVLNIVPLPAQRRFEHLMLDILNEQQRCARMAPIDEDFLEKTDLRVHYPDLKRQRGARIQVTQISDATLHREKTARIRRQLEYVVLSPLTLAQFAAERGDGALGTSMLDALWACLPGRPSGVRDLAMAIRHVLLAALDAPVRSPLGPLAQVPGALREVIRVFVRREAFLATDALRERERSEKGHRPL